MVHLNFLKENVQAKFEDKKKSNKTFKIMIFW